MIKRDDLARESSSTVSHPQTYQRQDRAVCDVCDWDIGWNLNTDVVEKYFRKHQIETGHTIGYTVQELGEQTFTYLIQAD